MEFIYCPYCGQKIAQDSIECRYCGEEVAPKQPPKVETPIREESPAYSAQPEQDPVEKASAAKAVQSQTKVCASCGGVIEKSAIYCPHCKKMADTSRYDVIVQNKIATSACVWSFFVPILGIILGIIGLIKASKSPDKVGRGSAIAGIVIGSIGWVFTSILFIVAANWLFMEYGDSSYLFTFSGWLL